jgi:hypothetical protein
MGALGMKKLAPVCALAALLLVGCGGAGGPSKKPVPDGSAAQPGQGSKNKGASDAPSGTPSESKSGPNTQGDPSGAMTASFEGHTMLIPPEWQSAPPSNSMRLYEAKITTDAGEAEFVVFRLGGSAEANFQRWEGQFTKEGDQEVKVEQTKINTAAGVQAEIAEYQGAYQGMSGPVQPGFKMIGAVIPIVNSDQSYFIKLTGSAKAVDAAKPGALKALESFK